MTNTVCRSPLGWSDADYSQVAVVPANAAAISWPALNASRSVDEELQYSCDTFAPPRAV